MRAKSLEFCPTVCDPVACSPPGSSVLGILQARILEWMPCPPPGDPPNPGIKPTPLMSLHWQGGSLPLAPPGKPLLFNKTTLINLTNIIWCCIIIIIFLIVLQEGGHVPGPGSEFLSNTQKCIVQGDTCADKARGFIGKGRPDGEQ